MIDQTIRFETNRDMDTEVQAEKASIYEQCIRDLETKYGQFGTRQYEVIGLWFGARGVISNGVLDFTKFH